MIVSLSLAVVVMGRFGDRPEQSPLPLQEEAAPDTTLTIPQSFEQRFVSRPYPELCVIHQERLRKDRVRIAYGLRFDSPNDEERFPHSNKWIGGGCVPTSFRYITVMYCPTCREKEAEVAESNKYYKPPRHR